MKVYRLNFEDGPAVHEYDFALVNDGGVRKVVVNGDRSADFAYRESRYLDIVREAMSDPQEVSPYRTFFADRQRAEEVLRERVATTARQIQNQAEALAVAL